MKYIKHIPWLVLVLVISGVAIQYHQKNKAILELMSIQNKKLMAAKLDIGRARTKMGDAHALLSKLEKNIRKEVKKRKATLSLYAELQLLYTAEQKRRKTLTSIVTRGSNTTVDLPKGKIFLRHDDGTHTEVTSMVYTYKDFRITIEGDAVKQVLSYKLHQKFRGKFVESKLPNGAINHYAKFYEVDGEGKDVGELTLEKFEVVRGKDLPNKIMWWNPKIDVMLGVGVNSKVQATAVGEIGFSASAYGKTPDDITWRFARIGVGTTNHDFSLTISPAQLNLGKFLPVISNMWLTPAIGFQLPDTTTILTLGISVVF